MAILSLIARLSTISLLIRAGLAVDVDVEDFGAKADGKTLSSPAFNAALLNVSARGGGTVYARAQGVYIVGWIELRNHTTLHIAPGTFVNASTRREDCLPQKQPIPAECGGTYFNNNTCGNVFTARNAHNFTIRGGGTVDGGGLTFDTPPYTGPRWALLSFYMSSDAIVEDLNLYNPSAWFLLPNFCQRMHFRRLHMVSDFAGPHHKNTDGFDPACSRDISFTDSHVHNGDDCIAVKSGKQPLAWSCAHPTENILVKNVTCMGSHGLTLGSELAGGIRNVTFSDVRVHGTDGFPSAGTVKIKLPCGRGGYVRDVLYENISAYDVATVLDIGDQGHSTAGKCSINGTTVVSNVTIRNVRAQKIAGSAFVVTGFTVEGRPAGYAPIGLKLENISVSDYKQVGFCSNVKIEVSGVSPPIPALDATCAVSSTSSGSSDYASYV